MQSEVSPNQTEKTSGMDHIFKGVVNSYRDKIIGLLNEKRSLEEKLLTTQAELQGVNKKANHNKESLDNKNVELARLAQLLYKSGIFEEDSTASGTTGRSKKGKKRKASHALPEWENVFDTESKTEHLKEKQKLSDKLDIYIQVEAKLQYQLARLESQNKELQNKNEALNTANLNAGVGKDKIIERLYSEVNTLISELENNKNSLPLSSKASTSDDNSNFTNGELDKLRSKAQSDALKIERLNSSLQELQLENDKYLRQLEDITETLRNTKHKSEYHSKQNKALASELSQEKKRFEKVAKDLDETIQSKNLISQQKEKLEEKVSIMQQSVSWRYTKPLRAIGSNKGRKAKLKEDRALVVSSGLFDGHWYVKKYPEAQHAKTPLTFFLEVGLDRGDDPGLGFNSQSYKEKYPDVANSDLSSFRHYITYGMEEGRSL